MLKTKLAGIAIASALFTFSNLALSQDLRLVRFGPAGEEQPGLVDSQGRIRDLSAVIDEISADTLSDAALARIAEIPEGNLPLVSGNPRLGVPLTGIGKIVAIGFNYINHAAEMEVQLPTEPLTFMKATSSLTGPFDNVIQPRNARRAGSVARNLDRHAQELPRV